MRPTNTNGWYIDQCNHPIELDVSFKSEVVEFDGCARLSRNSASLPVATSNWHKHVSTIYNA